MACLYKILAKHLRMNFGIVTLNQSMEIEQSCVTWILIALLFLLKLKIFIKILHVMLKDGLILLTIVKMIKELFPIGENKKIPGLFKDELGGKIMTLFVGVRAKNFTYLMDDDSEHKKTKGTKKCIIKRRILVKNYENCLLNNKTILKLQQRFKSDYNEVYTEEVNKIAVNSNDDKRIQTLDKITTYPYGTNLFKACESEMIIVRDYFVEKYENYPFFMVK